MRATASRSSRRGGALILALLFLGAVTVGFVTWIGLIRQRARVADLEEHQTRKRLAAANAEVLARDYLLQRVLSSDQDDSLSATTDALGYSTAVASSWSGSSQTAINTLWSGFPLDASTLLAGLNGFSPTYDYPYSKSFTFTTSYKALDFKPIDASTNPGAEQFYNDTTTYRGYVRSRNLLLGGDLLVLHRSTVDPTALPSVTGNVAVQGRVVHFAPEVAASAYTARSQRFTAPTQAMINVVPADLAGAPLLWSNLAWTPLSSGNVSSPDWATDGYDWRLPDYSGRLNFIDAPVAAGNSANVSNSLRSELIGGSTITPAGLPSYTDSRGLVLESGIATFSPCLGSTVSDLPNVVLDNSNNLTEIVIEGQTGTTFSSYAQYRPALALVYTQTNLGSNLTTIRLRHQNRRRLLLALKKDPRAAALPAVNIIVESSVADSEWHLMILAENVPLNITYSAVAPYVASTVRLYGGIETNAPVFFPASPQLCEINLQTDTRGLIRLSPRLAWVETFLTGKL